LRRRTARGAYAAKGRFMQEGQPFSTQPLLRNFEPEALYIKPMLTAS
jgi:hypothetical protein